jgi:diaminohydroxyphosphoribosylaminopyrimidine deaminase/5-amino-6-(5-phosphoribosylamino)uracil reductase
MNDDRDFMGLALRLAEDGLGRTWPNPSVGCVIVRGGEIIGRGRTANGGRPHAETQALAQAGDGARGATAYVTLEPCHTHGQTPPCVDALINAGIARIVIACADPFQQTKGDGLARLEAAGINVIMDVCRDEALRLNEGFFTRVRTERPFITAKLATSLDARIALGNGQSRWITGEESRAEVHRLRARHDAILTGIGTVRADDPALTARVGGEVRGPVRIVLDRNLTIAPDSRLVCTANVTPLWLVAVPSADMEKRKMLEGLGVRILEMDAPDGLFDVAALARRLGDEGLNSIMLEAGGRTLSPFLKAGLIDRLVWFRAPVIIGGDGVAVFDALRLETLETAPIFRLERSARFGGDVMDVWNRSGA